MVGGVIVGTPVVTAGDTLEIDGQTVKLWGVRAPGIDETCSSESRRWACGAYAFAALYRALDVRSIWCVQKERLADGVLAQCFAGVNDLAQSQAELGWVADDPRFTSKYTASVAAARAQRIGIWP